MPARAPVEERPAATGAGARLRDAPEGTGWGSSAGPLLAELVAARRRRAGVTIGDASARRGRAKRRGLIAEVVHGAASPGSNGDDDPEREWKSQPGTGNPGSDLDS